MRFLVAATVVSSNRTILPQHKLTMLSITTRTVGRTLTASKPALSQAMQAIRRGYHDNIVEHYENPRNVGALDKNASDVGTVRADRRNALS